MNIAANNQKEMVFSYNNHIIASKGQQPPVISAWQPLVKLF